MFLDLESPQDQLRLGDPELFLSMHADKTLVLDEVQIFPHLFPVLRAVIDKQRRPGRFLLLGSASRRLINQTAESLAGRVSFLELGTVLPDEYAAYAKADTMHLMRLLVRGGFPESLLAESDRFSFRWRQEFIRSYVERDLPQLGLAAPSRLIHRLLQMLAHLQGQLLNMSKLAESLGISPGSVRNYLDFLQDALLVRLLPSWQGNMKKRLVKAPKVFIRDTGVANYLLNLHDYTALSGHPNWGSQWETLVIESSLAWLPSADASFYRTSNGSEADLVLEIGDRRILIEAKASSSPKPGKGYWSALEALSPDTACICAPVESSYPLKNGVMVLPLWDLKKLLAE